MAKSGGSPASKVTETIELPTRPRASLDPVPQIADYRFVKVIGSGAFGTVWLAEETMAGVFRAIKVLRPSTAAGDRPVDKNAVAARAERELAGIHAYQVQTQDHPHLVRILKTGLCTLADPDDATGAVPTRAATVRERSIPEEPCELSAHPPAKAGGSSDEGRIPSRPRKQAVYYVMEIADHAAGPQPHQPVDYEPLTLATLMRRTGRLPATAKTQGLRRVSQFRAFRAPCGLI